MDMRCNLQPGDVLVRNKSAFGIIDHYGLYVGNGMVVDNHPDRGVSQISLATFLDGRSLQRVKKYMGNSRNRKLVVQRAYSMIGMKYHVKDFNCEHLVNMALGVGRMSEQVTAAGVLFFFSVAIWGLSKVR